MADNVVLVKYAGIVPQCAVACEKLWIDAGAPAGLYTNLLISHAQSDPVVDDSRIRGVALTVALRLDEPSRHAPGKYLKPWSMELGKWTTVYPQFLRWSPSALWDLLLEGFGTAARRRRKYR
jgi:succinate-semialdehyde dehydrogenase/glutarate-semialdehyde dehydrogenase